MAISYTGTEATTLSGTNFQATDSISGKKLPVKVPSEALQDYGKDKCLQKGKDKFTNGDIGDDGSVSVTTTDFK